MRPALRSLVLRSFPSVWMVCLCTSIAAGDDGSLREVGELPSLFAQLDVNGDKQLTLDEFLEQAGPAAVRRRDFTLFDFNGDNVLSKMEFAAVDESSAAFPRGAIPDPFDALVSRAMEAIDESYEHWNLRPEEMVDSRQFVTNFMKSISTDGSYFVSGRILRQADPDEDNLVSRKEALQFLEQQLGVRWIAGPQPPSSETSVSPQRLREPSGRVVHFARFLAADTNRDGNLDKIEFASRWWNDQLLEEDFEINDLNGDGVISVSEYADYEGPNHVDPVAWFQTADRDLDALLDPSELAAATIGLRRDLIDSSFTGFDDDNDGKLSLQEYRLSMHANVNYSWEVLPQDKNRDDRISFDEFEFNDADLFHLQRRFYFHRLDADRDGSLSSSEVTFKKSGVNSLIMMSIDGKQSRTIVEQSVGSLDSPDVSPDGKWLLFHSALSDNRVDDKQSKIQLLELDTLQQHELCDGMQPSWSADGNRFVCARGGEEQGIWIVDREGTAAERISDGWAPQWSPDGNTIAFLKGDSLWIHDVSSGKQNQVIAPQDHSYDYFWWNSSWSPDSRRLILLGVMQGRSEAVLVDVQSPATMRVRLSETVEMGTEFVWSPDGERIIFPMRNRRARRTQWFEIAPDSEDRPRVVAEFDRDFLPKTGCFTPDGQWYISVFQH